MPDKHLLQKEQVCVWKAAVATTTSGKRRPYAIQGDIYRRNAVIIDDEFCPLNKDGRKDDTNRTTKNATTQAVSGEREGQEPRDPGKGLTSCRHVTAEYVDDHDVGDDSGMPYSLTLSESTITMSGSGLSQSLSPEFLSTLYAEEWHEEEKQLNNVFSKVSVGKRERNFAGRTRCPFLLHV